jgi:superfamily II DNA/RNA helicase
MIVTTFDTVLVFSRTKHGADRIARRLESSGIKTGTIHSNRSQNQRLRALKDFKSGAVRVLVATDIAARGIDVDGISHVVNYDFPMHSEDYVHRIGRTGRDHAGRSGAIAFARAFHRSRDRTEKGGRFRLQSGCAATRRAGQGSASPAKD